jgi:enterobactin synthetase component D
MFVAAPNPAVLDAGVAHVSVLWNTEDFTPEGARALGITIPSNLLRAVAKRQAEFVAGRYCAREALRLAGATTHELTTSNDDRSPVWPAGFVGSITHTAGFASAAVAPADRWRGIGLDSESLIADDVAARVGESILTPGTLDGQRADCLPAFTPSEWLTLVFSAKESAFKCLYPLTKVFFGFHDMEVTAADPTTTALSLKLRRSLTPEFATGFVLTARWHRTATHVHTAATLRQTRLHTTTAGRPRVGPGRC